MMEQAKINVGVVGVGALGRHHARLYNLSENANVIGIYDVSRETAEKVGAEFGLKVFDSPEALAELCDALSVAVPATQHHETSMPLLRMNKHLLIEKPIAATVAEAEEIATEAKKRNLVLAVGHVERFNPAMDFLQKHASETRFIEAHRLATYPPARPGMHRRGTEVSVVLDLMIHDIDLILTMVQGDVERIDAIGIPVLSKTEDIASVRIKFSNGSAANITASRVSMEPMRRFRVFLKDCYMSMDYANHSGMVLKRNKIGLARKDINLDEKNALAEELENFLLCVKETKATGHVVEPKVTGEHGLRALRLAIEITRQIQEYNKQYGFTFDYGQED
jgi:predicted dehydrogenase